MVIYKYQYYANRNMDDFSPLFENKGDEESYPSIFKRSLSTCSSLAFVSWRHKIWGWSFTNQTKASIALIPFMFHEMIFYSFLFLCFFAILVDVFDLVLLSICNAYKNSTQ